MNLADLSKQYDLTGKTIVVTGGAGILCGEIATALVGLGANVAVLDLKPEMAAPLMETWRQGPGKAIVIGTDVLSRDSLQQAADQTLQAFGKVDALINGAGGNNPRATTTDQVKFFDLPPEALQWVFNLNILGTILPSQTFGKIMAEQKEGNVINISSMNAFRPLTRVVAYSAAKAGVSNFTQWLAVHMAQNYAPNIRVNAIAPGFFVTNQNRALLTNEATGELTPRGASVIAHTPMNRFGEPSDLVGAVLFLLSPLSSFISGVVLPIDGGFSAFSGV